MLKNNGKKAAISVGSAACLCLLLLLVLVQQHHRAQVDEGTESSSALQGGGAGGDAAAREDGGARVKRGFSAYFTKLARGRRDAEKPARSSAASADPPPAEDLRADDVFIAVKTTKKFHQSRLNLLLDTWISRNMQQVQEKTRMNS